MRPTVYMSLTWNSDDPDRADLPERIGTWSPLPGHLSGPAGGPRHPLSFESLRNVLSYWLATRLVRGVTLLPGGCTAWMAADICGQLNDSLGSSETHFWDIEREVPVYQDRDDRIAVVLNQHTGSPGMPMVLVGMVAESPLQARHEFLNAVHAEVARLRPANLLAPYLGSRRAVVVLCTRLDSPTSLQKHGFQAVTHDDSDATIMCRELD